MDAASRAEPIPVARLKAAQNSAEDLQRSLLPSTLDKCSAPVPDGDDGLTQDEKFLAISRLEVSGRTRSSETEQTRMLSAPPGADASAGGTAPPLLRLRYGWVCQCGFYPEDQNKKNQDNLLVAPDLGPAFPDMSLFGVFDGHGKHGTECSSFAVDRFSKAVLAHKSLRSDPETALTESLERVNKDMHRQKRKRTGGGFFDDTMAGTTAISVVFIGDEVVVANVGDSRAVVATDTTAGNAPLEAQPLSADQTPYRHDERERCRKAGAVVMTMDQLEGYKRYDPNVDDWGDEEDDGGDPPRLWVPNKGCPGVAFTRSLGDELAESIGCVATPEVIRRRLTPDDKFIVIASDGVFEFLSSQTVVDMVSKFADPYEAARALVAEAYKLWLHYEVRTDDITVIVIFTEHRDAQPVPADAHAIGSARGSFSSTRNSSLKQHASVAAMNKMRLERVATQTDLQALLRLDQQNRPVRREMSRRKREVIAASALSRDEEGDAEEENDDTSNDNAAHEKTPEELEQIQNAIATNFLFQHLNPMQLQEVLQAFTRVDVKQGDEVIRQGELGDRFYVVGAGVYDCFITPEAPASSSTSSTSSSGQANSSGNYSSSSSPAMATATQQQEPPPKPLKVHTYEAAQGALGNPSFGELALMYSKPRAATVVAARDGHLWALPRRTFRRVLIKPPNKQRMAALRAVSVLASLGKAQLQRLADTVSEVHFADGDVVIRQGEVGDTMYILERGAARCFIADRAGTPHSGLGSLHGATPEPSAPAAAAAAAASSFKTGGSNAASSLKEHGEGHAHGLGKEVMRIEAGGYFGERSLLNDEPRAASVVAVGEVSCLYISRRSFEEVLGPLSDIISRHAHKRELTALAGIEMQRRMERAGLAASLQLSDLKCRAVVSESGPTVLRIVHPRDRPDLVFTLKSVQRAGVEQDKSEAGVMRDRALLPMAAVRELSEMSDNDDDDDDAVMATRAGDAKTPATDADGDRHMSSPAPGGSSSARHHKHAPPVAVFSVLKTFVGSTALHTALEGVACGTLGEFMAEPLPELTAAFVAADALLGLERLHLRGVLSRSVNPQMLMVDDAGRVRLCDLHCGKFLEDGAVRTFTMCGLAGYIAPEQVKSAGHGFEADFWALGVLVFEMLTGRLPFAEREFFKKIGSFDPAADLDFAVAEGAAPVSGAAQEFVRMLMHPDPTRRMTSVDLLMRHAFLQSVDEAQMRAGELPSPLADAARAALSDIVAAPTPRAEIIDDGPAPSADKTWFEGF